MSKAKKKILERLVSSAQAHVDALGDAFLCPTCLRRVLLSQKAEISDAHIIPQAASGGVLTLLCRQCNSFLGSRQDKWLGEYLRLTSLPDLFVLRTKHQKGYFSIGGVRVSGSYRVSDDGAAEFFIWENKTSPESLMRLSEVLGARAVDFEVTVPSPLLENRRMINVGFLTAAYLLWFRAWTYTWALQDHLDAIRAQILAPTVEILDHRKYLAWLRSMSFDQPTIGVGVVGELPCLFAGIADRLVLLPPACHPNLYEALPEDFSEVRFRIIRELIPVQPNGAITPFMLLFAESFLLLPDCLKAKPASGDVFFIGPEGEGPMQMHPISEADFDRLQQHEDARVARTTMLPLQRRVDVVPPEEQ